MPMRVLSPLRPWLWRGLAGLLLVGGLVAAPAALADDSAPSTITVYAPGAPLGAPISVQQQLGSGWATVPGSATTLFSVTYLGVPYESWTVDPTYYGQGPFRWVIDNLDGHSVWATSDPFFLPGKGGLDFDMTLGSAAPVGAAPKAGAQIKTLPAPAFQAPVLKMTMSGGNTFCHVGDCASAEISTYITGLPVPSWIAVEWQDPQGYWHPVENWEGPPALIDPPSQLMYAQWVVMPDLYGRGPFRWAIYSGPTGGVLGVSPSFNLPTNDRQNDIRYLSPS